MDANVTTKIKSLLELYSTFFFVGLTTFGGGLAMLPIMEHEVCDKKKWVTEDELMDYYAIAQSTPGIIAVNVATFCGKKIAGTMGAILATIGVVTPSIIIITAIAKFIDIINQINWVRKALMGINVAVAANLTYTAYNFTKRSVKNVGGAILYLLAFVLIFFFKVRSVWIVLSAMSIGIVYYWIMKRKGGKE
jgi:chromate transporter